MRIIIIIRNIEASIWLYIIRLLYIRETKQLPVREKILVISISYINGCDESRWKTETVTRGSWKNYLRKYVKDRGRSKGDALGYEKKCSHLLLWMTLAAPVTSHCWPETWTGSLYIAFFLYQFSLMILLEISWDEKRLFLTYILVKETISYKKDKLKTLRHPSVTDPC